MTAKILIVDDAQFVRDLLVKILVKEGGSVRTAATGAEAVRLIEEDLPELIITDVVMPGMDGFALLRHVKAAHPSVKIVVLTGYARRQSISDFLLYGADGYLAKPFQVAELLQVVAKATAKPAHV